MFLLQLFSSDGERKPIIGAFETMEEGEAFVSHIPTYERVEEDGFVYEYLQAGVWPDYFEVKCKGHIVHFPELFALLLGHFYPPAVFSTLWTP